MLKMFFALKDTDTALRERMERWLISDINRREKDAALQRVFEEMLNGDEGDEPIMNNHPL